jgi:hypothetical protein
MNKRMIIIIFYSLTNIIAKEEQIIKHSLQDYRYLINTIFGNSMLSGIEVNIDKYGVKFTAVNNKLSKNNKHTVLSLSRDTSETNAVGSIYIGGNITLGDSTHPIIITANNTISWPSGSATNLLGIDSNGQLITTTGGETNRNQLGQDGYNQINCFPNSPITITSSAPTSGDIIFTIDTKTNGNIKFFGKNLNLVNGLALLAIDSNNNIITTENSIAYIGNTQGNYISVDNSLGFNKKINTIRQPSQNINISTGNNGNICINSYNINTPSVGNYSLLGINSSNQIVTINNVDSFSCTNLSASGTISLGTFTPGSNSQSSVPNIIINSNISDGINFNGNVYINNSSFPLPGANQTTPLIIDNNGKIGILLSSIKYKKNIKPLHISAEAFDKLEASYYNYKTENNLKQEDTESIEFGFIAEQVYKIPELQDLVILDKNKQPLSINYYGMIPVMTEQIQKNRMINKINEENIQKLSSRIEVLEEIIKNLQKK